MSTWITNHAKELGIVKIDAKTPLTLVVKKPDIERAKSKDATDCAFACSVKRLFKGVRSVYFFRTCAYIEYQNRLIRYLLPISMQKEIVAFDRSKQMEPGVYRLTPPGRSSRLSAVSARSKKRSGRHKPGDTKIKRTLVGRHVTTNIREYFQPNVYRPATITTKGT
jgi:hypothetical protein